MIGAERSGTTLVMAMLGCHPRIAVPEVVWYYPRFRPYLHTYGDLSKEQKDAFLLGEFSLEAASYPVSPGLMRVLFPHTEFLGLSPATTSPVMRSASARTFSIFSSR